MGRSDCIAPHYRKISNRREDGNVNRVDLEIEKFNMKRAGLDQREVLGLISDPRDGQYLNRGKTTSSPKAGLQWFL